MFVAFEPDIVQRVPTAYLFGMRHRLLLFAIGLAAAVVPPPLRAAWDDTYVESAWAYETANNARTAEVYVTIVSPNGDVLNVLSSVNAEIVQVQEPDTANGTSRMRQVENLVIPAGEPVVLGPDGPRIVLLGLKTPLVRSSSVRVRLFFEEAGQVDFSARVLPLGAPPPGP